MLKKITALFMALLMLLSVSFALAEATAEPEPEEAAVVQQAEDKVLATLGGEPIYLSEVEKALENLANYIEDPTDYRQAVEFVVQQRVLDKKIKDMGFDQFSADEEAAFLSEAQGQWDEGIQSYVSYYLAEDTDEAREAMKKQAAEFYTAQGFSVEMLAENLRKRAGVDRMSEYLVGDYEPTEEEIQATFQQYGAQYQQAYENDIMAYEYNTIFNQQPSWYTPEGYRGIIHILLKPDEALMEEYSRLLAAYEEQQSAKDGEMADQNEEEGAAPEATAEAAPEVSPEPTTEPVSEEQLNAARQKVMDSRQKDIDDIYARLEKGESFADLVKEYGEDPGMTDENTLAQGYSVHQSSIAWDPEFTKAAFSDKMQQVGDHSDPVLGTYGIHILYYLRDVPAGLIMTDAIHQELVEYLKSVKENDAFAAAYEDWKQESGLVLDEEAIQAAIDTAKAKEPDPEAAEEEGLVALPEGGDEAPAEGETPETQADPEAEGTENTGN